VKIVSNSSVLIGLSSIGKLSLLRERFPQGIVVPEAVRREVIDEGEGRPGAREISESNWIKTQKVEDKRIVELLLGDLDKGEAEAIALAREVGAGIVLLDERDARRGAKRMNLKVLGTVGILMWAKKVGKLQSLKEELNALRHHGRFRIGQAIFERALREVDEL
jgi:predicted nucleic acid-binding protein